MVRKWCFAVVVLLGLVSTGCQTPYGSGCAGGCCNGSCGVASPSTAYYPPAQSQPAYAPAPQQALPPAFSGGSGSR